MPEPREYDVDETMKGREFPRMVFERVKALKGASAVLKAEREKRFAAREVLVKRGAVARGPWDGLQEVDIEKYRKEGLHEHLLADEGYAKRVQELAEERAEVEGALRKAADDAERVASAVQTPDELEMSRFWAWESSFLASHGVPTPDDLPAPAREIYDKYYGESRERIERARRESSGDTGGEEEDV